MDLNNFYAILACREDGKHYMVVTQYPDDPDIANIIRISTVHVCSNEVADVYMALCKQIKEEAKKLGLKTEDILFYDVYSRTSHG